MILILIFFLKLICLYRFLNIWFNSSSANSFFIVNGGGYVIIDNVSVKSWSSEVGTPSQFPFGIICGGFYIYLYHYNILKEEL
jgi:hypothetical protein